MGGFGWHPDRGAHPGAGTVIAVHDFTYRYPDTDRPALSDLNLEIADGQFCAIAGANGAGKSTLCYLLAGFVPHFFGGIAEGEVHVSGFDLRSVSTEELSGHVGLVFDDPFSQISGSRFTVREELAFGLENLSVPRAEMDDRIDAALEAVGLLELGDRSPFALSGGQQQRLAIASVLVMRPSVLILDEPTSNLDPQGSRQLLQVLESLVEVRGSTVILVENRPEWLAEHADRVVLLAHGRVVADGSPRQVLGSELSERHGVRPADFTLAARAVAQRGLVSRDGPLPVTLEQAVEFLR